MKERNIISIDLKSFFASCECVERGLDPYKTPLVVADTDRGDKAMSLAVSPYLRNRGIKSRCRVFEIPKNLNIMFVKPRIKLYQEYSKKVFDIYKSFISEEDIHFYSIDEVFMDVTDYLKYYNKTDTELALLIMKTVLEKTGLTTTAGIGPNVLLAKVAMDIEAKHNKNCLSKWTYKDIETKLWNVTPLTKIWGIGKNTERKLNNLGIYKVGDINNYPRSFYIKRFGNVMGNDIFDKANGIYFPTIKELNSRVHEKSMSMSQILYRDYSIEEAILIIKEMNDMLNSKLRSMKMTTSNIYLGIDYSKDLYKRFHDSVSLKIDEDDKQTIYEALEYLYNKNIEDLPIRKVSIAYSGLKKKTHAQLSLFDTNKEENNDFENLIDEINKKYGRTSILRASSLMKSSTIKNRKNFKEII